MRRIVVAGASGFVGRALVARLAMDEFTVLCLGRTRRPSVPAGAEFVRTDYSLPELSSYFAGADLVINLAARVHRRGETSKEFLPVYMAANCDLPVRMAKVARDAGVRRFVQISSVAAIASSTAPDEVADDSTTPRPSTPYGISKLAADRELAALASTSFAAISLRPPAIYGRGAPGPAQLVAKLARLGLALPVDSVASQRSIIFVDNLISAMLTAATSSRSGAYIVADSAPRSVGEINRRILEACGCGPPPSWFPPSLLDVGSRLMLRRRAELLLSPAAFDGSRFRQDFGWTPPLCLNEAFRRAFAQ